MNKYYNQSFRLKTEKAIESVNNYEVMQLGFRLKLANIRDQIVKRHNFKTLERGEWKKIQLLTATSELFQLLFPENRAKDQQQDDEVVLKIIIKNFTGKHIYLSLSTRPEVVKLQLCEYKINGEKIIKLKNPSLHHGKTYLTIHSPVDLVVFKIKYEFVDCNEEINRSRLKSSSLQLIRLRRKDFSEERDQNSMEKEESPINSKKGRMGSPRSQRSIVLNKSILESARVEAFQKEKERFSLAKQKKANLELYREKNKSLKQISYHCSSILYQYKSQVGQITEKSKELVNKLAIFIKAASFVRYIHSQTEQRELGLKKAIKSNRIVKKCAKKMMSLTRELRDLQPNRARRELLAVFHHSAQIAKTLNWEDKHRARTVIQQCLNQTFIGMTLNKVCEYSARYRAKVRTIQRYWKDRNKAQMTMFKFFLERQMSELLQKHISFELVREQFFERNMLFNLGWQYLKDSSLKIKNIRNAYTARLHEIEEIKQMNIEINHFNSKSLKKYHKHLLEVPRRPAPPVLRYFRDLSILKSMLRSWFQIQYRRQVRKLKKEGKSVPKQKKSLKK